MKFSHLTRIYTTSPIFKNQTISIEGNEFHYLKSVLRLRIGENFRIFNEQYGEFTVRIIQINKNNLSCQIENQLREVTKEKTLILAISIIKPEKLIEAIKAATSLGVTAIMPIISNRTQYNKINKERILKCIIEASEQSERLCPPELAETRSLQDFCSNEMIEQIIFASEDEDEKNLINKISNFHDNLAILIGPEGGFSDLEREYINSLSKTNSISLGNTVLRSEIATIAAISCIQMMRV